MKWMHKQGWHFLSLDGLIFFTNIIFQNPAMQAGEIWGQPTSFWFWLAVLFPVVHQVFVWAAWRAELVNQFWTGLFGLERGFLIYRVLFGFLILARPVTVILLAYANRDVWQIEPNGVKLLSLLLLLPSAYLGYSVARYFGIERAFGRDHFDPAYRDLRLETRGIYQFTSNGMYWYGFLILYVPGLLLRSPSALLVAFFQHFYIWVHFLTVEKPDMDFIYVD